MSQLVLFPLPGIPTTPTMSGRDGFEILASCLINSAASGSHDTCTCGANLEAAGFKYNDADTAASSVWSTSSPVRSKSTYFILPFKSWDKTNKLVEDVVAILLLVLCRRERWWSTTKASTVETVLLESVIVNNRIAKSAQQHGDNVAARTALAGAVEKVGGPFFIFDMLLCKSKAAVGLVEVDT